MKLSEVLDDFLNGTPIAPTCWTNCYLVYNKTTYNVETYTKDGIIGRNKYNDTFLFMMTNPSYQDWKLIKLLRFNDLDFGQKFKFKGEQTIYIRVNGPSCENKMYMEPGHFVVHSHCFNKEVELVAD
jgi:hypothetical protein